MAADVENLPYARKYRPNSVKKYIGNEKLKTTVMNVLKKRTRPQVFMFWGASGCGKTSFSRILAKEYSCQNRDPESGACGVCPSCLMYDEYIATGSTDLLGNIKELNIADQNGKQDLDDVFADMEIPVFGDEWKIYIFDECHKASNGLQNRFLKVVEEPPENILIIFCTTNPEGMLETLKNRVQVSLPVMKPKVRELAGLLRDVCRAEGVDYDTKGLEFIANRGELTIRTALQNLWQVVMDRGSGKYEDAIEVFETISDVMLADFFKKLKKRDILGYVTLLYTIKSKMDLGEFLVELRDFIKRGIFTINGIKEDGVTDGELAIYRDLFGDLGVAQICSLLNKVQSLNVKNLELELITLGYTGFDVQPVVRQEQMFGVVELPGECEKENANALKVVSELDREEKLRGVGNVSSQMETVDLDAVLSMGGELIS